MVSRGNVKEAALSLLKVIAKEAKRTIGVNIKVVQRSCWMVKTSERGSNSKVFERKVFNARAVDMMYQLEMRIGVPGKEKLQEVILGAGFKAKEIEYGLILKLVREWFDVSDPLNIGGEEVERVIEDFTDTIIGKSLKTSSRYALIEMDRKSQGVRLDDEVILRKISPEELWEFGRLGSELSPVNINSRLMFDPLSEDWMILEIAGKHRLGEAPESHIVKDAVLIDMLMSSSGRFRVINLGIKQNSWFDGPSVIGDRADRVVRALDGGRFLVDKGAEKRMVERWPEIIKIFKGDKSLKPSADRLLEGLGRSDLKDSVLDYAIGLESLLTRNARTNVSYRFALRGAHIINWEGGHRKTWFDQLKEFYDVRSAIAHGRGVGKERLDTYSKVGAEALLKIWWWFVTNTTDDIDAGTMMVEDRILE